MRKSILYLLVSLIAINLAYALFTTNLVKPQITNTFNETLNNNTLIANLTSFSDGSNNPLNVQTSDSKTFIWTPISPIDNGYYYFQSNAVDIVGNNQTYSDIIFVNATVFSIKWDSPKVGVFQSNGGTASWKSNLQATCRYSYSPNPQQGWITLSSTNNFTHSQVFTSLLPGAPRPLFLNCTDSRGLTKVTQLNIGWDDTAPIITNAEAVPPTVSAPLQSELRITANEPVSCTTDGQPFDNNDETIFQDYKTNPTKIMTYPEQAQTYNHNIICKNRAQLSTSTSIQVQVDPNAGLLISVESPPQYTPNTTVKFKITTNQLANCQYGEPVPIINMSSGQIKNNTHTATSSTLAVGPHSFAFACVSESETKTLQYDFVIDNTAPTGLSANISAICKSDELGVQFNAKDNESGIDFYNYTLSSNQTLVNWTMTTSSNLTISSVNLSQGKQYKIEFKATNKAGLSSVSAQATQSFNPNQTACLEKDPPTIIIKENRTQYGIETTINCTDISGCQPTFLVGLGATAASCNATTTLNFPYKKTVAQTSYLCWDIADKIGNHARDSKLISVEFVPTTCGNGGKDGNESDVDCGGNCPSCDVGGLCGISQDCLSNYCVQGICKASSCSDGEKNGFESDIDCGGNCKKCDNNQSCNTKTDCSSNYCLSGTCTPSSCSDSVWNGDESDVDCGGSCDKCLDGKSCTSDIDCTSGTCEEKSCVTLTEDQKWERWAKEHSIYSSDRQGDADKDGLSNFDEFKNKTDPNVADTDGDGYSDNYEVKAGTDPTNATSFPSIKLFNTLLIALGVAALIVWALLIYVFKKDKNTSKYFGIVGAAGALLGILGHVLVTLDIYVPTFISVILLVITLGSFGYVVYRIYPSIARPVKRPAGAPLVSGIPTIVSSPVEAPKPRPTTAEDIKARKTMEEMLKKQRDAREEERKKLFGLFGAVPEKPAAKPEEKPIIKAVAEKISAIPDEFDKLSKIVQSKEEFGKLGKLIENKTDSFSRLEKFGASAKGRIEELAAKAKGKTKKGKKR